MSDTPFLERLSPGFLSLAADGIDGVLVACGGMGVRL